MMTTIVQGVVVGAVLGGERHLSAANTSALPVGIECERARRRLPSTWGLGQLTAAATAPGVRHP